jgi:hypothetical protein
MTSFRQIEANRRNARKSTGPITEEGKQRSRRNAVRHGLTAETVIGALEDAEDYKAFEAAITADYDAQSAVERDRFAQVVMPYIDDAYRLAHWLTGNSSDAEDVVQDASLRAFRAIRGYAGGSAR